MPQKKKRRVPWNKINNQHSSPRLNLPFAQSLTIYSINLDSAATTSSFSQGLPVAVPGPSTNFQPYQAEIGLSRQQLPRETLLTLCS